MSRGIAGLAVIAAIMSVTPLAESQGNDAEFTVAPYFVIPWMTGKTTLRGVDVDVDVGPSEILDNLDFGVMGFFEYRKNGWAFAFDGLYMKLTKPATVDTIVGPLGASATMKQEMYELTGAREVAPWVDVVFGARINRINGSFETLNLPITGEDTKTWVDPLVGVRLRVPDIDPWRVGLRADVGGFGAGSDFAWQLLPIVGYDLADWFTLAGGYRVLSMDYKTGEGTSRFGYDITTHGPFFGAAFRF